MTEPRIVDEDFVFEPMTRDFLLWRCLHGGPLNRQAIGHWEGASAIDWDEARRRNVPLLSRLMDAYGTCAIVARKGERVVGQLRFYPRNVSTMPCAGGLCMQQTYPAGPSHDLCSAELPPLPSLTDRTLVVRCMTAGSPGADGPFHRRRIGTRMAQTLVLWARAHGWHAIEATAYHDLPILYAVTGQAGRRFWLKLGFRVVEEGRELHLDGQGDFTAALRAEAAAHGLDPNDAARKYTMRLVL